MFYLRVSLAIVSATLIGCQSEKGILAATLTGRYPVYFRVHPALPSDASHSDTAGVRMTLSLDGSLVVDRTYRLTSGPEGFSPYASIELALSPGLHIARATISNSAPVVFSLNSEVPIWVDIYECHDPRSVPAYEIFSWSREP